MDILKQGYPDIDDAQLDEVLREADGDVFEALDVLRISFGEPGMGKLFSLEMRLTIRPQQSPRRQGVSTRITKGVVYTEETLMGAECCRRECKIGGLQN